MSGAIANAAADAVSFPLAPMSPLVRTLTTIIYAITALLAAGAILGTAPMFIPLALVLLLYAWIWLRFRPTRFSVDAQRLAIDWPLRRVELPRADIIAVRLVDRAQLKEAIGWGLRVGAGGLWGGFGRLWTKQRGLIHLYISRTDRFVWVERRHGKPWLITPDRPEEFVRLFDQRPVSA